MNETPTTDLASDLPSPFPPPAPVVPAVTATPPARRGRLLAAVAVTALVASAAGAGTVALLDDDGNTNGGNDGVAVATQTGADTAIEPMTARPEAALDTASIVASTADSIVAVHATGTGTRVRLWLPRGNEAP